MEYYMVSYEENGNTRCMAIFAVYAHAENYCRAILRSRRYASARIQKVEAEFGTRCL